MNEELKISRKRERGQVCSTRWQVIGASKVSVTLWACFYSWQSRFERATWSVATFVRLHRSLRSLAPLALLAHFTHSLVGQLKLMNLCSRWNRDQREESRSPLSLETRPYLHGAIQKWNENITFNCILRESNTCRIISFSWNWANKSMLFMIFHDIALLQ